MPGVDVVKRSEELGDRIEEEADEFCFSFVSLLAPRSLLLSCVLRGAVLTLACASYASTNCCASVFHSGLSTSMLKAYRK